MYLAADLLGIEAEAMERDVGALFAATGRSDVPA